MSEEPKFAVYDKKGRVAGVVTVKPRADVKSVPIEPPVRVVLKELLERVARLEAAAKVE